MTSDKLQEQRQRESERRALEWKIQDARNGKVKGRSNLNHNRPKSERIDSREAGIELLRMFVDSVRGGGEIEPALLHYLADCFGEYLELHQCNNKHWPVCMNTQKPRGNPGYPKRDRWLIYDYADYLEQGGTREEFMDQVEQNPPSYWEGTPPTREGLLNILPNKKHSAIKSAQAINAEIERLFSELPK